MFAIDTNVLVYAHRKDSKFHEPAAQLLRRCAEGAATWAIPWPCVYEFYSIVTHPRIYAPPSTPEQALAQLRAWLSSPTVVVPGEPPGHWRLLADLLRTTSITGPVVHDARVAAICEAHGIGEIVTLDRDFSRFPKLNARSLLAT